MVIQSINTSSAQKVQTSGRVIQPLNPTSAQKPSPTQTISSTPIYKPKTIVIEEPKGFFDSAKSVFSGVQRAVLDTIERGKGAQKKVSNEELSKKEGLGAPIGRFLQKTPDTTIKVPEKYKSEGLYDEIVEFTSGLPGAIAQSYGRSLELLSTPDGKNKLKEGAKNLPNTIREVKSYIDNKDWGKAFETALANPALSVALDVSDFIPIGGVVSFGVKKSLGALRKTAKEIVKEVIEEASTKTAKETVKRADDYISKFGNVVDSDRAKELLPGYTPDKAAEFHKPSRVVRDEVYNRLLETNKGKGDNTVYFTAGGAASGKSESLVRGSARGHAIAYDTTLASPNRVADVKKAIDSGYDVQIDYTASDPVAAWDRVRRRGRQIPLESFARDYEQSLENVKKLYQEYKDNPDVNFGFRDNRGEMGQAKVVTFDEINKIEYNREKILKEINEKQIRQKETSSTNNQGSNRSTESRNEAQISPRKESIVTPIGDTVPKKTSSKIALSIERKAVEDKLTKGFEGVAGYDKITIKDQAQKATDLINSDFEKARRVVRGEEELPSGLRGTSLITAMEEQIKKTGDSKLAHELANSPLVSETSAAAQELRLAAERQPDSLVLKLREVKQAREEAFKKKFSGQNINQVKKNVINDIKKKVKTVDKYDWSNFVKSLPTC